MKSSHYNKIHDSFDEEHCASNNNNYGSNSSPPTLTNINNNEDNLNNNEDNNNTTFGSKVIYSIVLIAGVCIANLWENEALQGGEITLKYVQPGIIIYVNHSFLLLNFIIGLYLYSKRTNTPLTTLCCSFELIQSSLIDASGWSRKDALKKTTWLAFLYFVPNLFWAASLNYIPVSISVAMQQSQCGFVYLLGVYWSVIPANRIKSIACVFCILGVILISVGTIMAADDSDKNGSSSSGKTGDDGGGASNNNVILGLIFAIVFPTTISFFSIYFKMFSKHCINLERTCVLTGVIGITNTFFMIPFILLQPILGLGPVILPDSGSTFVLILYIGFLAFLYNFFYMTGISVMGPLTTSLGVALCLPTSIVYDMIFKSSNVLNGVSFVGCAFVFGAFVSIIRAGDGDSTAEVNNNNNNNNNDDDGINATNTSIGDEVTTEI